MSTLAEEAEILYGQRLNRYFYVAGFVLLIYDHGLTLESEVRYIWRHIRRPHPSKSSVCCYALDLVHDFLLIMQELLIEVALCLRILAMYFSVNRRGIFFLAVVSMIVVSLGTWAVVDSAPPKVVQTTVPGCYISASNSRRIRLAAFWEGLLAGDLIFLGLTLYRGYTQHFHGMELPSGSLWHVLIRDGILYYVVICFANGTNIVMLSATMICRLMLNIHDTASSTSDCDILTLELSTTSIQFAGHGDDSWVEQRRLGKYSGK
ncbi:hypothetical protein K438DRAFT_1171110 [Mycena galopus ATCC 62051]|nr:hypothetical protein K438DRAFT_1171110 [Mycena galopus ATCC 62051]